MKKFLISLLLLFNISCIKFIATSSEVASKTTRLNREMIQIKGDLALKEKLTKDIETNKKKFLEYNNLKNFGKYDLNVMEGRVLLTGIVYNQEIKEYIINKITEDIKVRELLDELKVGIPIYSSIKDFFIKRNIITKIFFKTKIKSLNYEVSVVDGYVYVIGIAENNEELELLLKLISTVKGVKEVNNYAITVDSEKKLKLDFIN